MKFESQSYKGAEADDVSVPARKENARVSTKIFQYFLLLLVIFGSLGKLRAQSASNLFFREDWKESEAALPVTQEHVANPNLVLSLHGPGKEGVKKSNHPH